MIVEKGQAHAHAPGDPEPALKAITAYLLHIFLFKGRPHSGFHIYFNIVDQC